VVVVLFAAGSHLVGPVVQQLRGKSEYAEYVGRVMDFIGVMSNSDPEDKSPDQVSRTVGDTAASGRAARKPGVSDSSGVPRDLPLHPGSLETLYNVGPGHVLVYQRVAGLRPAAISQIREAMGRQGWKQMSVSAGDWSTIIRWSKDRRSCSVEFDDDRGATEIWIRSKDNS
jgi:hypothetical protein